MDSQWNLDIMQYIGPLEARMTEDNRGRGLYATRKIKKGEFLIVEKAFADSQSCTLDNEQLLQLPMIAKHDGKENNLRLAY